ncbi:MAG: hypothetical protein JWO69_2060 [Thermoleophilia bacterium]|nr:hypothetical protein [Thermoleophilia bacterium]
MTTEGAHAHATQAMAVESPDGVPRVNLWCRACQDFLYDEAFLWASLDTFVQRTQQHQALHQKTEGAAVIRTCAWTLDRPGRCCHYGGPGSTYCDAPAVYAALFEYPDEMVEHLRCVDHAALDRERSSGLVAMKLYRPRVGAS